MQIRTFRARIALLSVLCSSLVLLGSSLVSLNILWQSELRRIDQFIGIDVQRKMNDDFGPPGPFPPRPFRGGMRQRPPRFQHEHPPGDPPFRERFDDRMTSGPTLIFLSGNLDGQRVDRSENWPPSLTDDRLPSPDASTVKYSTLFAERRLWRVCVGRNTRERFVMGVDMEPAVTAVRQVAGAFLLSIPVALLLIALGAVFMARRALQPVHVLTGLVERITARGLGERVDEARVKDAEFEKLIQVFNQMMDRLERSFMQANRFSADAAHELRTPITILQGHVERMLHLAEPGSEMQQDLGDMIDEIHRIKSILEKLLLLARLDAGEFHIHLEPVSLSPLVESIVEDLQALAPGITVEGAIEPGVLVNADAALLETAIQNLGGNAIKYNLEEGGWIKVELRRQSQAALLAISNSGPKISQAEHGRIFDRFYRADQSRSRQTDGLGLGLSLAREIVQAHHGTLELVDSNSEANRFEIKLPLNHNHD